MPFRLAEIGGFARFAFGAAGSAGAQIELGTAEQISRGFSGKGKHKLT